MCEGDVGAAAGFRRVSGAFAAICTGQLAAIEDKIHIFSSIVVMSRVEGRRRASLRRLLEKAMEWMAMVICGAYKRRAATKSGWISI